MKSPKMAKPKSTNPELKSGSKTKSTGHKASSVLTKRNNKFQKRESPSKLSTLDNWLQKLYQSKPQTNSLIPTKTALASKSENEHNTIERFAKLVVRLERLDISQLKNCINKQNVKGKGYKRQTKKRIKIEGLCYKNRSSEYTRLENKEYKCAKCDFMHSNLISIRAHFDKEHSDHIYKCELCPFQTTQQYYFNSHVKHHSRSDIECPHCKKMIKWFSYNMHIKTHERNDKTEYKCKICEYQSYNHANVKRHMLTLHKDPQELQTFNCDSCNYVTILEGRLKQHKKQVHSKEGVWITCEQCEYTTRNKSHLTRHVNDLHREKSVQCSECSQLFSSKDNLKYHMQRKHTDQSTKKFYYCEMCPKEQQYKTTEKGNLARHILAHRTLDEIEVFACHKCPYLGKSKNALKTHLINAHLPEMHNFKCKICGYSTSTKSRYNNHIRDVHGRPVLDKFNRQKKITIMSTINQAAKGIVNKVEEEAADFETNEDTDVEIKEEIDDLCDSAEDAEEFGNGVPKKHLMLADFWTKQDSQQG